jgi:hypothetical protein
MVKFIPVRYQKYNYPPIPNTEPKIQEITANFFNFFKHKETLQETDLSYHLSLHTDPGYRGNKDLFISSKLLKEFPVLSRNVTDFGKTCISKLWCNKEWSEEFAHFLIKLTEGIDRQRVKVIEIHPPFDIDYNSRDTFIEIYKIFEDEALKEFPSTIINIENRCNPNIKKKGGKFLLSSTDDIKELSDLISKSPLKLKLQLIVDIPQLLSEHQMLS